MTKPLNVSSTVGADLEEQDIFPPLVANGKVASYGRLVLRHFNHLGRTALPELSTANSGVQRGANSASAPGKTTVPSPPTLPPTNRHVPATYNALQEWEGYVAAINGDEFEIVFSATRADDAGVLKTSLPLSDLEPDERSRLRLGSVFRWTIGYERTPAGQRKRVSRIIFRQLPQWTEQELRASKDAAATVRAKIRWD